MNVVLVTNQKGKEFGSFYAVKTKKALFTILKDEIKKFSKKSFFGKLKCYHSFNNPFLKAINRYITQDEYISNVASLRKSIGGDDSILSKVLPYSIVISKISIINAEIPYNAEIYNGIFKDETQYNYIVSNLPSDDSAIYITDLSVLYKFGVELHDAGIYLYHRDLLYKSEAYSETVWDNLKNGVISVFSSLNATSISLIEESVVASELEVSLAKELTAFAPKIGLNLKKRQSFELNCKLNANLDLAEASKNLYLLDDFKGLRTLAEKNIKNPCTLKSINQKIELNISFGMNVKVLSALQGVFEGGYTRKLNCEIIF